MAPTFILSFIYYRCVELLWDAVKEYGNQQDIMMSINFSEFRQQNLSIPPIFPTPTIFILYQYHLSPVIDASLVSSSLPLQSPPTPQPRPVPK